MREVIIKVRDDLDSSDAQETIQFAVRGVHYEIDLSAANIELFEKSLQQFVDAARRVQPAPQAEASTSKSPTSPRALKARRAEIREWAIHNGWPELQNQRGRVPYDATDAYRLAHPEVALPPALIPQRAGSRDAENVAARRRAARDALDGVTAQQVLALGDDGGGVSAATLMKATKPARGTNPQKLAAATMAARRREKFGDKLDSLDMDRRREIRAWAKKNGFTVRAVGHISDEILTAYFDAHPGDN